MLAKLPVVTIAVACACSTAPARRSPRGAVAEPGELAGELDRLVADVCDKQVVFLGEASHGDGRTFETKAVLVRRLIESCGFDSVFVEAGMYDFLALEAAYAGGTATPEDVANAVGALWSVAAEIRPLIETLHAAASDGRVRILGLDDQIHSTAFFAQRTLPGLLAAYLPEPRRGECEATIARHTAWTYDDAQPYTEQANQILVACLTDVRDAIATGDQDAQAATARIMASNLLRAVARDFGVAPRDSFNARDASMFENFQWHRQRLGPKAKSIVWCATIHGAKSLDGVGPLDGAVPLGKHVRDAYGDRAAVIGFSAYAGATGRPGKDPTPLTEAPPDSLEGQCLAAGQDLRYLDAAALGALGGIAARPIRYEFVVAHWDQVLDGLVVFRREHPATSGQ